jgi:hypothetical protein
LCSGTQYDGFEACAYLIYVARHDFGMLPEPLAEATRRLANPDLNAAMICREFGIEVLDAGTFSQPR